MNTFATLSIFAILIVGALAAPAPEPKPEASPKPALAAELDKELALNQYDPYIAYANSDVFRQKKSYAPAPSYGAAPSYAPAPSYGGAASISSDKLIYHAPAPHIPCSKAIVVSCAPSVLTAPCSAPPAQYSSGGY